MERVWTMSCRRGSNHVSVGYDEGSILLKVFRLQFEVFILCSLVVRSPPSPWTTVARLCGPNTTKCSKSSWASLVCVLSSVSVSYHQDETAKDGEVLALVPKDLGNCEIYPQTLSHNPNGRFGLCLSLPLTLSFVVVCGDGEYIIHTALSFRNKSFGQAVEFVWSADSSELVVSIVVMLT